MVVRVTKTTTHRDVPYDTRVPCYLHCFNILRKVEEKELETDRSGMEWIPFYQFCVLLGR